MCLIGLGEAKSQARLDLRGPNHRLKSMVCASTRPRKLRETVIESSCDRLFHHGMTQRPAVLEDLIFVLFGVPEVESGLETDERDFSWDFRFDFFQNFEAVLYDVFYCPFREVVHLLSADSEKSLPGELVDTLHPRLFTGKECDAGSLFRGQKIIKRKVVRRESLKFQGAFICSELTVSPELVLLRFRARRKMTHAHHPNEFRPKRPIIAVHNFKADDRALVIMLDLAQDALNIIG